MEAAHADLLTRFGVEKLVFKRDLTPLPEKLLVSYETWRNLINQSASPDATNYDKLYGIPIEFDNSIPLAQFRAIYVR